MSSEDHHQNLRSKFSAIMMTINISLGALNIGYVLSYLTLSLDTIFANLNIPPEEQTQKMSLLTGILPLGCVVGVFVGYNIKKIFTYKQCIYIADLIGITSILAIIANYNVIVAFRFFLGVSNGISSFIVPIYVKSLCPQQFYSQMSMLIGYGTNTGLVIGQLMGIGYINYNGATSTWWRIVFLFPSLICIIRSSFIHFVYNYDSPEQLIKLGNIEQAKFVICQIYKDDYVEEQYKRYENIAIKEQQNSGVPVSKVFDKEHFITLQVGIISMLAQIWCGFYSVIYYSGQIFSDLSNNNLVQKTVYTFSLGLAGFVSQFSTIYFTKKLGNKYILMFGAALMTILNIIIGVLSNFSDDEQVAMAIFIFLLLLIMVYASTFGPAAWSIVPQLNNSDGTYIVMEHRWAFQAILVFSYPYITKSFTMLGVFLMFAGIDFLYLLYSHFFLIDGRGKTNEQLIQMYRNKFGYRVVPIDNNQQKQQNIDCELNVYNQNQGGTSNQNSITNNQQNQQI